MGGEGVDVWLDSWQVDEDHFEVSLGERVDWETVTMDASWVSRLFVDRTIRWTRDTDADATRAPEDPSWHRVQGRVSGIEQVTVAFVASDDPADPGLVPVPGAAVVQPVTSLWDRPAQPDVLVGFVVRVA
jgi:hypothetical protein